MHYAIFKNFLSTDPRIKFQFFSSAEQPIASTAVLLLKFFFFSPSSEYHQLP